MSAASDSVSRDELAVEIPIRVTAGTWLKIDVDEFRIDRAEHPRDRADDNDNLNPRNVAR